MLYLGSANMLRRILWRMMHCVWIDTDGIGSFFCVRNFCLNRYFELTETMRLIPMLNLAGKQVPVRERL